MLLPVGLQSLPQGSYSYIDKFIHPYINHPFNIPIYPPTHPSVLSFDLLPSIHLSIHPPINLFFHLPDRPFHPSIHWSVHPSVQPFIHLTVPLSIYPSIDSLTHPFIRPFIHSFIHPLTWCYSERDIISIYDTSGNGISAALVIIQIVDRPCCQTNSWSANHESFINRRPLYSVVNLFLSQFRIRRVLRIVEHVDYT